MREEEKITVRIKYKGVEEVFSGDISEVWVGVNRFFSEFVPTFKVVKRLVLNVDLQELLGDCEGVIAFTEDGGHLLVSRDRLTDNETLVLHLLAAYVGYRLGFVESDAVSKEALQRKLGKSGKITSTRLGELVKSDIVAKTADGRYRLTTFGVAQVQREFLPRIKAKIGG